MYGSGSNEDDYVLKIHSGLPMHVVVVENSISASFFKYYFHLFAHTFELQLCSLMVNIIIGVRCTFGCSGNIYIINLFLFILNVTL